MRHNLRATKSGIGRRNLFVFSRAAAMRSAWGASAVEMLMAIPILLLLGLGGLQASLLLQARLALNLAVEEAAREGTTGNAQMLSIQAGLARGLTPWLYGASDFSDYTANVVRAVAHVAEGTAKQWIRIRQLSPTEESFADWAVPALDENGVPLTDTVEIPNDNLHTYMHIRMPNSVESGRRGSEPIGTASGQTLLDANTLKLDITYGVPANVPIVGPMLIWAIRAYEGCAPPSARRVGLIGLGTAEVSASPQSWVCPFVSPLTAGEKARLPIRSQATMAMQSGARRSGQLIARTQTKEAGATLGKGETTPPIGAEAGYGQTGLTPPSQINPGGQGVGQSVNDRSNGFSHIGGGRELPDVAACPGG